VNVRAPCGPTREPRTAGRERRARETLARAFSPEIVDAIVRVAAEEVRRELTEEHRFGWFTTEEAGQLLGGISGDAVLKRIHRHGLPAKKLAGRWWIERATLDRLIRKGEDGGAG
jgi:hypothetical protein